MGGPRGGVPVVESLKIAFVSSHHPSEQSLGMPRVVSFVGRNLAAGGHDVRVFYPRRAGDAQLPKEWMGMQAIPADRSEGSHFPFGPEISFSRNVARLLPSDLDVVVVNNEQGGAPVVLRVRRMRKASGKARPLCVDVLHGLSLRILQVGRDLRPSAVRPRVGYHADYRALSWLEGSGARHADLCITPSSANRRELQEVYGLPPQRIHVIHNGVSTGPLRTEDEQQRAREALRLDAETRYLFFLARDPYRKGFDIARGTIERLRQEGQKVVLLNAGNSEASSPGVQSFGSVSDEVRQRLLMACDAFFLPTRYEGYPLVVHEAASVGVPVFTSAAAHVELGVNGRDYVEVEPNTAEAHADAIRAHLSDPQHLRQMGVSGRAVLGTRTFERQAHDYLDLFRRGLAGEAYPLPVEPIPYRWTHEVPPVPGRRPFLSVVVLGWRRREYLRHAVESVLACPYPREDLDVLVIKGFEDPEMDGWLGERGVRVVFCPADPSGPKHALGQELALGEVICWLDDDDLFAPDKLAQVAAIFRSHPRLGFYHHGHIRMDVSGRPMGRGPFIPDFNCSCMAVRRSSADALRAYMMEFNRICDTYQCYGMMALGRELLQDPQRDLTLYRVPPRPHTTFALLPAYAEVARRVRTMSHGEPGHRALANVLRIYFSTLVRTPVSRRAEAAEMLLMAVENRNLAAFIPDLREAVCASIHPFSPEASRALYSFLRGGRVDWLAPPSPARLATSPSGS